MHITDVKAIHTRIDDPNIGLFDGSYDNCIIVIETSDGLIGVGECESFSPAIVALVDGPSSHNHAMCMRDILVGEDPLRVEALWDKIYNSTDYVGRRGLTMHVLGGIDLALWDIKGKSLGQPVHRLFGQQRWTELPAYGTIYPIAREPDGVREQIRAAKAMNLRHFKLVADPWWMDDVELTGKLLAAGRAEAGPEARIIVDAALAYRTADEGLRLFPAYQDCDLWFLEAPLPLDDMDGHAKMAGRGIDLGVGDLGLTHVNEYIEAMERGKADILQPDITQVGGFIGINRIAAAAAQRHRRVITHGYKTNITIAANLHFLSIQPQMEIVEFSTSDSPLRWQTTNETLDVGEDGMVRVPDAPGLGVTLNWEFLTPHIVNGGSHV